LAPGFKIIANFCEDNGKAFCNVCRQFVVLCQQLGLFSAAVLAIDVSKFKEVSSSLNFTQANLTCCHWQLCRCAFLMAQKITTIS
jgi:transposase